MKTLVSLFLLLIVLTVSACSTKKDFVRPNADTFNADTFKLGQTKYPQVILQMDEPQNTGEKIKNGETIKEIVYAHASLPMWETVFPGRALGFYFHNDTLVGQDFVSSFKSDNSNFDHTRISAIVKGKTTRTQVVQMLGKPTSFYIFPMVSKTSSGEAIGYNYVKGFWGGPSGHELKQSTKSLRVTFDSKDLVLDVDYSSYAN